MNSVSLLQVFQEGLPRRSSICTINLSCNLKVVKNWNLCVQFLTETKPKQIDCNFLKNEKIEYSLTLPSGTSTTSSLG